MNTIVCDNYKFEIEFIGTQININLTETDLMDVYQASIEEANIYVKPIKKFYSMIEKALNKELNYNIIITEKKGLLICSFSYTTEMVDIEESITFTKVNSEKTKELLLIERIKELTELTTPVFGYRGFGEKMIFDINSKVIDFRPFDDYERYSNFQDYNKLTKVKKIIMSTDSGVFLLQDKYMFNAYKFSCGCGVLPYCIHPFLSDAIKINTGISCVSHPTSFFGSYHYIIHFNHMSVYMPSVTEVEVYCSPYTNLGQQFTKFGSLPNLEKLVMIQKDNMGFTSAFLDIHNMISTSINKKLKHIILKNISTWIIPDSVDKAKLFAQVNNIRLDII